MITTYTFYAFHATLPKSKNLSLRFCAQRLSIRIVVRKCKNKAINKGPKCSSSQPSKTAGDF